jgi:hypothetical protein
LKESGDSNKEEREKRKELRERYRQESKLSKSKGDIA